MLPLVDFILQQSAWWLTILLVTCGLAPFAVVGSILVVVAHAAVSGPRLLLLGAVGAGLGFVLDSALVRMSALSFPGTELQFSTVWMAGLWAAFAVALRSSLRWLDKLSATKAALVASVIGPLAYRSGEALGVLEVSDTVLAHAAIAAAWAIAVLTLKRLTVAVVEEQPA